MFLARHLKPSELAKGVGLGHLFNPQPLSLEGMVEDDLDNRDNSIEYSALSYTWGDSFARDMIQVDGRVLHITDSLHNALQHLRDSNEDRTIWADAICIDQGNVVERGHQVAQMGTIYKAAKNVIIWLGFVEKDSALLLSALKDLQLKVSQQPFRKWQFRDDRWRDAWEELHGGNISGGAFHLQLANGLKMLTEKSWFKRVWILQEVANAKSAQIQCSAGTIDARFLALAPWLLGQTIDEQPQAVLDIFPGQSREFSWWNKKRNLGTLLWRFRDCEATDPRDRVYALLGIASDMANKAIQPDYSKSELQVLRNTCNYLFFGRQSDELSRLQRIQLLQSSLGQWSGEFLERKMVRGVTPEAIERFLDRQGQIEWNQGLRYSASFDLGQSTLALVLTEFETPMPITDKLFGEALKIGPDALDLLFNKCMVKDDDLKSLVLFAAEIGEGALDALFERCEIPSGLANDMIDCMTPLTIEPAERLYLGRWKHEFEISESMTTRLIRRAPAIVNILLRSKTSKIQITEAILRQAIARPYWYGLLLDRRNNEVNVSEEEAIRAINGGPETLQRCLDKPGTNFQVTEAIFEAAMLRGRDVTEMLFRRRESEVNIRQDIHEIHQLREDLCRHVLGILGRTKHTTMLREASTRYENANNSEPIELATAALGETTNVVQRLRSAGMRVSCWRKVHEIFRELTLSSGLGPDADELRFQGVSDGDVEVERWIRMEQDYGAKGSHRKWMQNTAFFLSIRSSN
ncbi:hypothetical protein Neosp_005626 [[Neocosmospora] mangrovei]